MPHNLFLHSRLVLSRKINVNSYRKVADAVNYNAIESALSLLLSYIINLSVIGTFAFYTNKGYDIDLENAAETLSAVFGSSAKYIWAIGLLAAG